MALDSDTGLSTGLSLFDRTPDDLLPVLLSTMVLDRSADLGDEVHFVTEDESIAVWAVRTPDRRVCILYQFVSEERGAIAGAAGGTCQLTEQAIVESGGAALYTGAGNILMAIGLAVDGFEEVWTSGGARFPIENNGFVVPLLPSDGLDGTTLQFESFALVGDDSSLPANQLAQPKADLIDGP